MKLCRINDELRVFGRNEAVKFLLGSESMQNKSEPLRVRLLYIGPFWLVIGAYELSWRAEHPHSLFYPIAGWGFISFGLLIFIACLYAVIRKGWE